MPAIECPTCHRTVTFGDLAEVPWRPFCSQRCKLVDLGKWLNEEYRVVEELPAGLPGMEPPTEGRE